VEFFDIQRKRNVAAAIAAAVFGVTMFLLTRRYSGINHDSVLYLGQGLMQRWPEIFGNDLFFAHGSQDRYSIFPWLLGKALAWVDPPALFLWGTLASSLLFAAASWLCLRFLLPPGQRYWAWLGVLCLPSFYGMTSLFSYGEQFLTPRPIAESLALLCIVQLLRRRWTGAAACLLLAGAFHPLQALATFLIVWPWSVMQDRRWLHLAWLAIPLLALAVLGIGPFGDMFRQADPEWVARLRGNTPQLFLTEWGASDFRMLAFDALLLGYASIALRGPFGRWCVAALVGLAIGTVASLVLVDGLNLVLPAGLQLWRVHWLAHWFAMAAYAALLFDIMIVRDWSRALLLVLVALLAWGTPGWTWTMLALLYGAWPRIFSPGHPRLKLLLAWLFGLGIAILAVSHAMTELTWFKLAHYRLDLYAIDRRLLAFPLFALGLPLLAIFAWQRSPPARRMLLASALLPLLSVAATRWDARSPYNHAFEQNAFNPDIFQTPIPADAQVFWDGEMTVAPWLVLGRASYYSGAQLAGVAFSRDTAIDGLVRANRMMPLMLESRGCQDRSRPYEERMRCHISDSAMEKACEPGPKQGPDFLVLSYPQPHRAAGSWAIMDPVEQEPAITFRLYRCIDVMQELSGKPQAAAGDG